VVFDLNIPAAQVAAYFAPLRASACARPRPIALLQSAPTLLTAAEAAKAAEVAEAAAAQAAEEAGRSSPVQTRHRVAQAAEYGPMLPVLPKRTLSSVEEAALFKQEDAVLRQLRMYLRECLRELLSDRKFKPFRDAEGYADTLDYFDVIEKPMALDLMMDKLNEGFFFY
jgi:hypothetical protein